MRSGVRNTLKGLAVAALFVAGPAFAAESYTVDAVHSTVIFKINHLGVSDYYGRFNDVGGTFTYDKEHPEKSAVDITIKVDSVDTNEKKRDTHIKGPDFFNSKQFPNMTFKSTAVKKLSEKEYEVAGDLTAHGQTKPITIKLTKGGEGTDPAGKHRAGFNTEFSIKRSDFGVTFMADKLGDEVGLIVGIEGVRG